MILLFIKPHPEPLLKCIEKLNLKPQEVIFYIGDAQSDLWKHLKRHTLILVSAKWVVLLHQREIPATLVSKTTKGHYDY